MNELDAVIRLGESVTEIVGRKQDFWSYEDHEDIADFAAALSTLSEMRERAVVGWIDAPEAPDADHWVAFWNVPVRYVGQSRPALLIPLTDTSTETE